MINLRYLNTNWQNLLKDEFDKDYFKELQEFIKQEEKKHTIYPPEDEVFSAFNLTPFDNLKAVIMGQDPYHGAGQAHGLSFSVKKNVKIPPSLKNIFKELYSDLGFPVAGSGYLKSWAEQGVLMLNATLTVRAKEAGSHQKKGWETFTNRVIKSISEEKENIVFILWGKFAQSKAELINENKHFILRAAHPSPFSAYNGFFGCKHFSKTNEYLKSKNIPEINWQIKENTLF